MADADKAGPDTNAPPTEASDAPAAESSAKPSAGRKAKAKPAVSTARTTAAKTDEEPAASGTGAKASKPAKEEPAADSKASKPAKEEPAASTSPTTGAKADEEPAAAGAFRRAGLKLHHLRPAPGARKAKTRVGRGEASKGKTAGRGTKGTKARDVVAPRFEGGQMPLHRRLPKLKGFSNLRFKTTYQVVNLDRLAALYPDGGDVAPDDLVARGAVRPGELVKVLGSGEAAAGLRVTAHAFSASAREKITAAGGTVTEL